MYVLSTKFWYQISKYANGTAFEFFITEIKPNAGPIEHKIVNHITDFIYHYIHPSTESREEFVKEFKCPIDGFFTETECKTLEDNYNFSIESINILHQSDPNFLIDLLGLLLTQ